MTNDEFAPDEISPAFAAKMDELSNRFSQRNRLNADAWFFIQTQIFPIMDDHSEMQARDIFVALTKLSGPAPQRPRDVEFIFAEEEPLGPYKGLAGYAIQKTAQRFKNTPLGEICQEALKPIEDIEYHRDYPFEPG
jgi:hypothetical protein